MERLIIIALVFLWVVIAFIAGHVMEAAVTAIKKYKKNHRMKAAVKRNITIYNSDRGRNYHWFITEH